MFKEESKNHEKNYNGDRCFNAFSMLEREKERNFSGKTTRKVSCFDGFRFFTTSFKKRGAQC